MAPIPVEQYLSLERAVAEEVSRVLESYLDPPTELAASLVADGDFSGARAVVESIFVDQEGRERLREGFRPRVFDALILGAKRLVPATQTLAARGLIDPSLVDASIESFVSGVAVNGVANYKDRLFRLIERAEAIAQGEEDVEIERSEDGQITKALTVNDIASRLNRAAFTGRPALATVGANLSTSRLTAYGYLRQAQAEGQTRFQITEVLDNLTCPICWRTHGQIYEVESALSQTETVLRTTDPDALKQVAPWPNQSRAGLRRYDLMSVSDRQSAGYDRPPFHPYCRGQLVPVGSAEPVSPDQFPEDIPKPADLDQPQPTTPPAFDEVRAALQDAADRNPQIVQFNEDGFVDEFGVSLKDTAADMLGPAYRRGFNEVQQVQVGRVEGATWQIDAVLVNAENKATTFTRYFTRSEAGNLVVDHDFFAIAKAAQGTGIGRETLAASIRRYREMDPNAQVTMLANIDVGGYAWARYGFKPKSSAAWRGFADRLRRMTEDVREQLPNDVFAAVDGILARSDPEAIWDLADLRYDVGGVPLGRKLLANSTWPGVLDLSDEVAMARFEAYVGR